MATLLLAPPKIARRLDRPPPVGLPTCTDVPSTSSFQFAMMYFSSPLTAESVASTLVPIGISAVSW